MKKKIVRFVGLVVVVFLLVIGGGFFYMDSLARAAIEVAGTKVLGVKTTVNKVSLGLLSGNASLSELHVANPEGCKEPEFMVLNLGSIAVTPKSLLSDVIRVPKIELSGMAIDFEQRLGGDSNLDVILANTKKFIGSSSDKKGGGDGKKFVVDELTLSDIVVTARASNLPVGDQGIEIKVPKIVLKDIGSAGSDPVGLEQLTGMIVQAVMEAAMEAGQGQLPEIFAQSITNGLGGLGDVFKTKVAVDLGNGLKELPGNVGKALEEVGKGAAESIGKGVEDAAKGVGEKVEGLFKKK